MTRALALLAACALAAPAAARAQSPADAFGGRIPPVSGQLYTKKGKLELTPSANLSLNDAFYSKYFAGLKVGWHLTESLSVAAAFAGGFSRATASTDVCPGNEGCHPATKAQLHQVPGELKTITGVELGFSPLYGKLNAFAEKVVHFDLSLLAGGDLVRHRGVLSAVDANAGKDPGTRSTLGAHVGVGARVYFGGFMALRLEVKDYLYRVPVLGSSSLQNQLFTDVGVSFFLPVGGRAR